MQQKKMFVSTLKAFVLLFFKVQSSIVHLIFSYLWKLNALELFMDDIGDVNVVIVGVLAAAVHLIISNKRYIQNKHNELLKNKQNFVIKESKI